ncbi:Nitrogen regulation protein NtrY [Labilithrix luteola]|uniref:Signal transduction histidine-protein kinase/phosphatase MprB n=1 Tax=Labilithrix luteola TaxID=1391654 RepID=A0A0K1PVU8_9BACT|nr:ATP-binding protein [Labilithrix luteola]AKU97653.1 Nitrogen regulation protein NtrY [Labilithrix luteola]
MRLAPRLALTFGLLAAFSTAGVGLAVRMRLAAKETSRFQREVEGVCARLVDEVRRQGEVDQTLIGGACQGGELVDRVGIAVDRGELDDRRTGFAPIVSGEKTAFDLDELLLAVEGGDIVGASPTSLLGLPSRDVDTLLKTNPKHFVLRTDAAPALVSRCTKRSDGGKIIGLVGARHVDPLLERLAKTLDVTVKPSWPTPQVQVVPDDDLRRKPPAKGARDRKVAPVASASAPRPSASITKPAPSASASANTPKPPVGELARASCRLQDDSGAVLAFDVLKSTRELEDNLHDVDQTVGLYAAISGLVAFVLAIILARSLSRPLSSLAAEAGKVAAGEARPLGVRGSGEVQELASAFDRMIQDLSVTRRRLAAASRVAAWREVARRVAHEVKNPLAPIRAAVETLRRLRAREDPRFDEYFDEATRTVLDEVHRIANIVTEFTRFARLPTPKPQDVDAEELARHVVQIHKPSAGDIAFAHVAQRRAPIIRADRDQIIQVLTNLVQNAFDAVKGVPGGAVTLTTDTDGHYVAFSVTDNGAGIAPEISGRLFEPYATNKVSGTGLGLAIAQRIAIEHNGELSYIGTSASGKGAVFRLLLPIEGPPPASESPTSDNSPEV